MTKLSGIVLTKNVEHEFLPALKTLAKFVDEIIIVDTGSTDNTLKLARPYAKKIIQTNSNSFSDWRNLGAQKASGEWLLYLDSDERIPPKLAAEILATIKEPVHDAYTIPRYEILLGKHLNHWPHSRVLRLIKKSSLKRWRGKLHEQPQIQGTIGKIKNQMIHLSHKNFTEKVNNTLNWSLVEAEALYKADHPKMVSWRFFRMIFTEFFSRFFKQGLMHDSTEGTLESIYQSFSKFLTYARLWEMQRKPSLKQTYQKIDKQILLDWQKYESNSL
jgi:glycosyltransferase involved in cell wall biosynthesis